MFCMFREKPPFIQCRSSQPSPTCPSCHRSPHQVSSIHVPARAVTSPPAKSELQIQREEAGICPQYKQGFCPHGISGNTLYQGSKYLLHHPKRCKPFCRYGSKHRYGCSQTQCPKFHPTLCPDSVSKKECFSPSCTYPHLKGTKRKPGQGRQPRSDRDKTRNSRNTRPPANASSNAPPEPYPSSQPPPHPTYATTSPPQDLSFLVNMVQELASKMSVIERGMISSTASIPQTPAPSSSQHSWAPPNLPTPAAPQHQHIVDHPYSSQVPLSLDQSLSTNFLSSSQPPRPVNPINPPIPKQPPTSAFVVLNIQGMSPGAYSRSRWKIPRLSEALLSKSDSFVPFIALTETWLKPFISDAQIAIPDYNVFRADGVTRSHGGALLYVHTDLPIVASIYRRPTSGCSAL